MCTFTLKLSLSRASAPSSGSVAQVGVSLYLQPGAVRFVEQKSCEGKDKRRPFKALRSSASSTFQRCDCLEATLMVTIRQGVLEHSFGLTGFGQGLGLLPKETGFGSGIV